MSTKDETPGRDRLPNLVEAVRKAASEIRYSDYLIGRGERKPDGGVRIIEHFISESLGNTIVNRVGFVEAYEAVEPFDSAAQQFLCMPFLSIAIQVGTSVYVDDTSQHSATMNDYLRRYLVDGLLVVGMESRRGLCWMTLYRRRDATPFTADDAELASYRVRAALFEWQRGSDAQEEVPEPVPEVKTEIPAKKVRDVPLERYQLIPVGRRRLDVAVRWIRGMSRKGIANSLGMSTAAVDDHIKGLRKLFRNREALAARFYGRLPPPRPLPEGDPESSGS